MVQPNEDRSRDGAAHTLKESLKPLRDRVVRTLGGTMPERGGPGVDGRARSEPAVPFLVGPLTDDRQVRPGGAERSDKAVNVATERATICRHVGRVNQYPKCHDSMRSLRSPDSRSLRPCPSPGRACPHNSEQCRNSAENTAGTQQDGTDLPALIASRSDTA